MTDGSEHPGRGRALVVAAVTVVLVIGAAGGIGFALVNGTGHRGTPVTSRMNMVPPMDLSTVSAEIAAHYEFAASHGDLYSNVPCYCGCQKSLGHRSLQDCFVRADGAGWDAHASGCAVCTQESEMVRTLAATGRSPTQIRAAVVARFGASL